MELTKKEYDLLHSLVEKYPDFPIAGITFSDLSLIYTSVEAMNLIKDKIRQNIAPLNPDCVIGCDARGFILGTIISNTLDLPLVLARKAGKLPGELLKVKYGLEYGTAELQMHKHIISKYKSPIIADDVLATGGTVDAISQMLDEIGIKVNSYFFLSEIVDLNAREKLKKWGGQVFSLLK